MKLLATVFPCFTVKDANRGYRARAGYEPGESDGPANSQTIPKAPIVVAQGPDVRRHLVLADVRSHQSNTVTSKKQDATQESPLRRDAMVVASLPAMVTVLTLDGRVIHQNVHSIAYFGDWTSAPVPSRLHALSALFSLEPAKFARMMEDVRSLHLWKAVLRVPASVGLHQHGSDRTPTAPGFAVQLGPVAEISRIQHSSYPASGSLDRGPSGPCRTADSSQRAGMAVPLGGEGGDTPRARSSSVLRSGTGGQGTRSPSHGAMASSLLEAAAGATSLPGARQDMLLRQQRQASTGTDSLASRSGPAAAADVAAFLGQRGDVAACFMADSGLGVPAPGVASAAVGDGGVAGQARASHGLLGGNAASNGAVLNSGRTPPPGSRRHDRVSRSPILQDRGPSRRLLAAGSMATLDAGGGSSLTMGCAADTHDTGSPGGSSSMVLDPLATSTFATLVACGSAAVPSTQQPTCGAPTAHLSATAHPPVTANAEKGLAATRSTSKKRVSGSGAVSSLVADGLDAGAASAAAVGSGGGGISGSRRAPPRKTASCLMLRTAADVSRAQSFCARSGSRTTSRAVAFALSLNTSPFSLPELPQQSQQLGPPDRLSSYTQQHQQLQLYDPRSHTPEQEQMFGSELRLEQQGQLRPPERRLEQQPQQHLPPPQQQRQQQPPQPIADIAMLSIDHTRSLNDSYSGGPRPAQAANLSRSLSRSCSQPVKLTRSLSQGGERDTRGQHGSALAMTAGDLRPDQAGQPTITAATAILQQAQQSRPAPSVQSSGVKETASAEAAADAATAAVAKGALYSPISDAGGGSGTAALGGISDDMDRSCITANSPSRKQGTGGRFASVDGPAEAPQADPPASHVDEGSIIIFTPKLLSSWGDENGRAKARSAPEEHGKADAAPTFPPPPPPLRPTPSLLRGSSSLGMLHPECWHEVWATAAQDPVTGADVIVLTQMDVTAKVIAERHLALVMETEHRLVEQLFPRHILQYITEEWTAAEGAKTDGSVRGGGALGAGAEHSSSWRPVVRDCNALATWHPEVTLLFADIKGFTPMCKEVEPRQVMALLNALYSRYDAMLDKYGVYKVETIGDCYFVAGGLIREDEDGMAAVREGGSTVDPLHAEKVFMFAKAMLSAAREVLMPTTGQPVEIRIGLHTGPVVSGVVGTRMPRFCLFGDTVNTASRMESTGMPGAIHASEATFQRLARSDQWEPTGGIEVKGKGLMQTHVWRPSPVGPPNAPGLLPPSAASATASDTFSLQLLELGVPTNCSQRGRNPGAGAEVLQAGGPFPRTPPWAQ